MSKGNITFRVRMRPKLCAAFLDELGRNNNNPLTQHMCESECIRLAVAEWINHRRRSRKQKEIDFTVDIYTVE